MKRQTALDMLPEVQQLEAAELLRQWKQKAWLIAAVSLAVTVSAALLLSELRDFGMPEAVAVCALCVTPVMAVVLNIQKRRFVQVLAAIPELNERQTLPQPEQKKTPSFRRICELVLITLLCPPLGILLLFLGKDAQRELDKLKSPADTPQAVLTEKANAHIKGLSCGGMLIFGGACCCIVLSGMLGFVAKGKLTALNTTAKNICISANAALEAMDEEGESLPPRDTVRIVNASEEYPENSLEWRIEQYFTEIRGAGVWYALALDGKGSVSAAWFSYRPLTEQDLVPPDQSVQLKLLSGWFHTEEAIGYYHTEE